MIYTMATLVQLSEWLWLNMDTVTAIGIEPDDRTGDAYCVWFAGQDQPRYLTRDEWTVLMDYLPREGISTFYQQRLHA